VWVREQIVREEREEEPPEEEQSADFQAHKRLMEMKQDIDRRKASGG
jgi:hypothetical protein